MKYLLMAILSLVPVSINAQTVSVNIIDESGSPVENAVISLVSADASKNFHDGPKRNPIMVQEGQEFVPTVLPVSKGSEVFFPNRDNFRHMIYSFSEAKRFEVQLYGGDDQISVNFDKEGAVVLGCNIHDNMVGYVYVIDTDNFAKSDVSGTVELTNLQPGTYDATVWHPNLERNFEDVTQSVVIVDGQLVNLEFSVKLQ